jgi:hypothetical protein
MKSFFKLRLVLGLALAVFIIAPASAVVLAEFTTLPLPASADPTYIVAQSFTPVGAGAFTNITFNFFSDAAATTPSAGGTAFLLSTVNLNFPVLLSSATPGFLGSAAAAGGFYNFGSSVTLLGGTQYFLYTNASFPVAGFHFGNYSGGDAYYSLGAAFQTLPGLDAHFRVTGDAVTSVPDGGPATVMFAMSVIGLVLGRFLLARVG